MHHMVLFAVYGWLTLSGVVHFMIDVVSHHVRDKHPPGLAASQYYGLNSSYAAGQAAYGALCLWPNWNLPSALDSGFVMVLSIVSGLCWLSISVLSISYWEPKLGAVIYLALLLAAVLSI